MSVTRRNLPVVSTLNPQAVVLGNVSGDTTTITSITLTQTAGNFVFNIKYDEMPKVTIIDGIQYRWTVKSTFMDGVMTKDTKYVKEAVLNIGTKLVLKKPFFQIITGKDPVNDPYQVTFSFYDLGSMWAEGVTMHDSKFDIDGKTAVPITVQNVDEDSMFGTRLTTDAIYRFIWSVGEKKYTLDKKLKSGATSISVSYTPPLSWNETIPDATYKYFNMEVQAIFGTTVYRSVKGGVMSYVPESCVPVINSISIADAKNRVPADWNMFVQDNSNVVLKAINVTPSYGSDIVSVNMQVGEKLYYGTPTSLPQSLTISEYGIIEITVTVKDKRGRTTQKTARITVVEYHPPTLQVDSIRCGESGDIENEGTYFLATTDTTYSTCNGKNAITLAMRYKLSSVAAFTGSGKQLQTGSATTVCAGDLDEELSYDVEYVLKDKFNTVTVIDFVSTAVYEMHFLHGGRGIAFGHKATVENAADFSFDAIFRNNVTFTKPNGEEITFAQIVEKLGL